MLKDSGLRLFIAVRLPENVVKRISRVKKELEELQGIRPVATYDIHITLKFLGNIDPKRLAKIIVQLKRIEFKKFKITASGIGAFPNENYVRTLWVGCKNQALVDLAEKVNVALGEILPKGEFIPHATVARVTKRVVLRDFIYKHKKQSFGSFECTTFELVSSELTKAGPVYATLETFECLENGDGEGQGNTEVGKNLQTPKI